MTACLSDDSIYTRCKPAAPRRLAASPPCRLVFVIRGSEVGHRRWQGVTSGEVVGHKQRVIFGIALALAMPQLPSSRRS